MPPSGGWSTPCSHARDVVQGCPRRDSNGRDTATRTSWRPTPRPSPSSGAHGSPPTPSALPDEDANLTLSNTH
eukprot:1514703-Pyramimonas_sp.AAC.1